MEDSEILIEGVGISGYRSFGRPIELIGPFRKINLFIGQNNVGKSHILSFIKEKHKFLAGLHGPRIKDVNRHKGLGPEPLPFGLGVTIGGKQYASIMAKCDEAKGRNLAIVKQVESILKSEALTRGTNAAWFILKKDSVLSEKLAADVASEDILGPRQVGQ